MSIMDRLKDMFGKAKDEAETRGVTPTDVKEDAKDVAHAVKHGGDNVADKAKSGAEATKDAVQRKI